MPACGQRAGGVGGAFMSVSGHGPRATSTLRITTVFQAHIHFGCRPVAALHQWRRLARLALMSLTWPSCVDQPCDVLALVAEAEAAAPAFAQRSPALMQYARSKKQLKAALVSSDSRRADVVEQVHQYNERTAVRPGDVIVLLASAPRRPGKAVGSSGCRPQSRQLLRAPCLRVAGRLRSGGCEPHPGADRCTMVPGQPQSQPAPSESCRSRGGRQDCKWHRRSLCRPGTDRTDLLG